MVIAIFVLAISQQPQSQESAAAKTHPALSRRGRRGARGLLGHRGWRGTQGPGCGPSPEGGQAPEPR
eukprot:16441859-Heterocapsa_arctica.AAC.1